MNYQFLNTSAFRIYKDKLKALEILIEPLCIANGFSIDRERYYDETLAININTIKNGFHGNICLQYIDRKGKIKFTLGLIKTYDIGDFRYYNKADIINEDELEFFEKNINTLLNNTFKIFNDWSKEDLTLKVKLPQRYD